MLRKTFYLMALLTLALSACTGKAVTKPAASTSVAKSATPAASSANCTDSASFVSDVTVPDNTNFDQGESFTKTWRVKNTGTCTWTNRYSLAFASGEQMSAPKSIPLSETKPGTTLDISVTMTAPAKDEAARADFELRDPSGKAMPVDKGTSLWVIITVGTVVAETTNTASSGPGPAPASCALTVNPANVTAVVDAINAYRTSNGLPALKVNPALTAAAQAHSNDMACNNLFVHTGSNGSTPQTRAAAAGYSGNVTENVYGRNPPPSAQETVTWWATDQADLSHNRNLLSAQYSEIGAGYSFFNDFGYYAVVFGAP